MPYEVLAVVADEAALTRLEATVGVRAGFHYSYRGKHEAQFFCRTQEDADWLLARLERQSAVEIYAMSEAAVLSRITMPDESKFIEPKREPRPARPSDSEE